MAALRSSLGVSNPHPCSVSQPSKFIDSQIGLWWNCTLVCHGSSVRGGMFVFVPAGKEFSAGPQTHYAVENGFKLSASLRFCFFLHEYLDCWHVLPF